MPISGGGNTSSKVTKDINSIQDTLQTIVIRGTATDGLNGFLEDTTKAWQVDQFAGKTIRLEIDNIIYYPVIISNTSTVIYFTPIELPTGASITLGAGGETEGQVTISLIGDLIGTAGNDYYIEIVNGNTDTGFDYITLDNNNKKFIITVDTNALGETRELMSGSMSVIIADNSEVAAVLEAGTTFDPGLIPLTTTPIQFTGGDDGIYVSDGDTYEIAYSVTLENLEGTKISYSDIVNDDTTGGEAVPASAEIVKAHGTSIIELSARNTYAISKLPVYLDRFKFRTSETVQLQKPLVGIELLDVTPSYCLAAPYGIGSQKLLQVNPYTLEQELLIETTVSNPDANPYWSRGKILPYYSTGYDYILLYAENHKAMYIATTNPSDTVTKLKAPTKLSADLKLPWLKNTGITYKPNATTGCITGSTTPIIYGEYILDTHPDYATTTTVRAMCSINKGSTFEAALTLNSRSHPTNPQIYHFHSPHFDPYNDGHVYIGTGDLPRECFIYRSTNNGSPGSFVAINDPLFSGNKQTIHRTTNMYFTADYIYWGVDGYITEDGIGTAWVRADRNLSGDHLNIEVLANLGNYVRVLAKTIYGLFVFTENRPAYSDSAFIWFIPYDDMAHPQLISLDNYNYGSQMHHEAIGDRLFFGGGAALSIGNVQTDCKFLVATISKSLRAIP
jgi:hypothetical protein